jgi:hypothetical protein
MFPSFHRFYWMGLKYNDRLSIQQQTAVFRWIDQLIPGPTRYKHWGQAVLSDNSISPEPNNLGGDEYCGGCNVTQKYGQPSAWGWGDQTCSREFPFMCRRALVPLLQGCRQPQAQAGHDGAVKAPAAAGSASAARPLAAQAAPSRPCAYAACKGVWCLVVGWKAACCILRAGRAGGPLCPDRAQQAEG